MPISNVSNRPSRGEGRPAASAPDAANEKQPEKFVDGKVTIETIREDGQLRWDVTFENQGDRPFVGTIAFAGSEKNTGEGFESMPVPDRGWKTTQHISAQRDHGVTPKPGELLRLQVRGYSFLELPLPEEGTVQLSLDQFEVMPKVDTSYFERDYVEAKVREKSTFLFQDGTPKLDYTTPSYADDPRKAVFYNRPRRESERGRLSLLQRALGAAIRGTLEFDSKGYLTLTPERSLSGSVGHGEVSDVRRVDIAPELFLPEFVKGDLLEKGQARVWLIGRAADFSYAIEDAFGPGRREYFVAERGVEIRAI